MYTRRDNRLELMTGTSDQITSAVAPVWYLRTSWLWQQPRMDVLAALAELGVR